MRTKDKWLMERLAVDLHIHSALSPCGDDFMTPGNIVGMAVVNELDAIAITDHNSSENIPAAITIAEEYGVIVIPGMELETAEEIHVVCLFPNMEAMTAFQQNVLSSYTPGENRPEIFGCQQIFNSNDQIIGECSRMLLAPTGLSVDDAIVLADRLGGIAYPAHVDRDSYSVLTSLGALPYQYPHPFVEVSMDCDRKALLAQYPFLQNFRLIPASDAHYLEKIQERRTFIEVQERSPKGIIAALKSLTI